MGTKIKKILKKFRLKRTTILILLFGVMSYVLIHQLFQLQILEGQSYIHKFETRITKKREINSIRGNIYDRDGNLLASNVLSYSVTFEDNGSYETTREKNLTLNGVAYQVYQILTKNGDRLSNSFHIVVDENDNYVFDVGEGFTLNRFRADIFGYPLIDNMKEEEKTATADDMMNFLTGQKGFSVILEGPAAYTEQELTRHNLPLTLTKEETLAIAIMRYQLNTNSFKKYMRVTVATNVCEKSVAAIMENQNELQGIDIVEDSVRQYIEDVSMGPILGYTGRASAEELATLREKNPDYPNDAIVGKAGIEQSMELTLQGKDGEETVTVDNLGKVLKIDTSTRIAPVAGNDVYLTIDTDWQNAIYKILEQRVAGILLSKIEAIREFEYDTVRDASQIAIPIYDVYNALISNSVIDIRRFEKEDASEIEKALFQKFLKKQETTFRTILNRLTGDNPPELKNETPEMQELLSYICNDLLRDTLGVLEKNRIDEGDKKYQAWLDEGDISFKDFLTYATSQNWINISMLPTEGDYLDSEEVYRILTDYITDYLKNDITFSKLLYKYMILDDVITGQELGLVLYEQGMLDKEEDDYLSLLNGYLGGYDFMIRKIYNLQITPAQLALAPCSASCVITDVNTGEVLACVSYPGYNVNRLANNMDTSYFSSLALDQSSPFFNKATQQETAPGSTLKLLSTIIGMEEGIIDDNTYIKCTGSFDYVEPPINCWNIYGHMDIEIKTAIEESCNYFFNMIGYQAGKNANNLFSENISLNTLQRYASEIGLDKKSGVEIAEAAPHVSTSLAVPSYIGQGTHLYSSTQLARYVTAIANSGTVYKLTLIDKITEPGGNVIDNNDPVVINQLDVSQNVWDDIHYGMRRVVQTHNQFDTLRIALAGKTGTAEVDIYHPNHGLFVGYAPYDSPQYGISVRIPNGYSSGNACLVANDVMKYIFELEDPEKIITGYASSDTSETSND